MRRFGMLIAFWLCTVAAVQAGNWPTWRGPSSNGVAPVGDYPTRWSTKENVVWKAPLPGRGASTPIVWEQRIFLTYGKDGKNILACLDWNGKPQWETTLGNERKGSHAKGTGSNPSAVTDGKSVFVYFKSGDLACVDFTGRTLWHKNLQQMFGEDTLWHDLGTSPVLTKECVVVAVMHSGPSFLAAFNKTSGDDVWKENRDVPAPQEAAQSYSTPVVVTDDQGKSTIYVLGADHVTAHNGETGKELWRVGGLNPTQEPFFRSIASPVVANDLVIAPYARGKSITAVKVGGSGDVTKTHVAWFKDNLGADVPTPAAHDGRVYFCTDRGDVACLDAKSGREIWRGQVESQREKQRTPFSASPILAGGHVYVTREDAKTFVLQQGDAYKLVAENELADERIVATPVFVDGRILIRTYENLYCIGK